ncbi:MAG: hypothetical protein RIK87_04135 [Fuerstiella sp.]
MNDVLNIARDGIVGGLGLIEVLKTANVRAGMETEQEELEAAIESAFGLPHRSVQLWRRARLVVFHTL